jgi:predicted Zn finger-like uncharacterized protein
MLIVCPNCGTSYRVSSESLGGAGRTVRCVNCHQVWFEGPHSPASEPAYASIPDPVTPPLIRPALNDVVDIGSAQADRADETATMGSSGSGREAEGHGTHVAAAPSIIPIPEAGHPHPEAPRHVERVAQSRAADRRSPRRKLMTSRHALPAATCGLALVLFCLVAARQQIVRFLPQTASVYARIGLPVNLRGLAFENIKTTRGIEDGVPMLVVEGEIVGTTGRHAEVPRLRFAVTDRTGREVYAWTTRPSRTLLPPGETLPFRSRLASPPAEASGISVRFFNRRDAQAGFNM